MYTAYLRTSRVSAKERGPERKRKLFNKGWHSQRTATKGWRSQLTATKGWRSQRTATKGWRSQLTATKDWRNQRTTTKGWRNQRTAILQPSAIDLKPIVYVPACPMRLCETRACVQQAQQHVTGSNVPWRQCHSRGLIPWAIRE